MRPSVEQLLAGLLLGVPAGRLTVETATQSIATKLSRIWVATTTTTRTAVTSPVPHSRWQQIWLWLHSNARHIAVDTHSSVCSTRTHAFVAIRMEARAKHIFPSVEQLLAVLLLGVPTGRLTVDTAMQSMAIRYIL
jgi:hypothetical protein